MTDHWEPVKWPTHAEVREIVTTIIRRIDETPDWAPAPRQATVPAPDETWPGWKR